MFLDFFLIDITFILVSNKLVLEMRLSGTFCSMNLGLERWHFVACFCFRFSDIVFYDRAI